MPDFEVNVLRTPDYVRILQDERKLTFSVVVDGHESHHQLSILEYPTKEKIEARMAEVAVQVVEEVRKNNAGKRSEPIPDDILSLVEN